MYWDWKKAVVGIFRFCIMFLSFSFAYQNLTLLNRQFLAQIPVGSILLIIIGILIVHYICITFNWYLIYLKSNKNIMNIINVIFHFCLCLLVIFIVLSFPMSLERSTLPNNESSATNNLTKHFNDTFPTTESINSSSVVQNNTNKKPAFTIKTPVTEITPTSVAELQYMTNPKIVNYEYVLCGNYSQIPYIMYGGMNNYLKSLPRYIRRLRGYSPPTETDFVLRDLDNEEQKPFIDPLVKEIQNITSNKDDQARIAISLVQNLNYDWDSFKAGNTTEKYPYEVLYTCTGVCSEKSDLLAYLLRDLGYGVVIFHFDAVGNLTAHAAVGIKCPLQYSYRDTGYCFVETTSPCILTDSSGDYLTINNSTVKLTTVPKIIKICNGNSFDSVSEEYNDTRTWNDISNNKVLNTYNYSKWLYLINKYGLKIVPN